MKESSEMRHASLAVWVETPSLVLLGDMSMFLYTKGELWLKLSILPIKIKLPMWLSGKESACQCRKLRRCWLDPWDGKIPWRRKWQPTPVFLPGKSHGQRRLVSYSQWNHKESDTTEQRSTHHMHLSKSTKSHVLHKHDFSVHIIVFQNLNT